MSSCKWQRLEGKPGQSAVGVGPLGTTWSRLEKGRDSDGAGGEHGETAEGGSVL